MKVLQMKYNIPQEFIDLGLCVSKFGEKSLSLKRGESIIFIFGSNLELREDFISRLCDSYFYRGQGKRRQSNKNYI